jgi:hypothetical protein
MDLNEICSGIFLFATLASAACDLLLQSTGFPEVRYTFPPTLCKFPSSSKIYYPHAIIIPRPFWQVVWCRGYKFQFARNFVFAVSVRQP